MHKFSEMLASYVSLAEMKNENKISLPVEVAHLVLAELKHLESTVAQLVAQRHELKAKQYEAKPEVCASASAGQLHEAR